MPGRQTQRKRQIPWGAVIILVAAAVAFTLSVWFRLSLQPGPTALERLIAEQAPAENVQALAALPNGDFAVGTSLGIITGQGRKWTRMPGLSTNVAALVPMPDGAMLLAGTGTGVARFQNGYLETLLPGDATAVVHSGSGHLFALVAGSLQYSPDTGRTWSRLADFGPEPMLALAAHGENLVVGGVQGSVAWSLDAGKMWESRPGPGGSVTALTFDPSKAGRLWATAGGGAYYTDDGGLTWRRGKRKVTDRPLVGLAPAEGKAPFQGITADGLLVPITE